MCIKHASPHNAARAAGTAAVKAAAAAACAAVLLFAGCGQEAPRDASGTDGSAYYAVYIDNRLSKTVPFGVPDVVVLDQGDGRVNELTVTQDGAHMSHATCPNQDCIKQGELTPDNMDERALGSFIVCLPHRVAIELVLGEPE